MGRDENIAITARRLADHDLWVRTRGRQGHPYRDPVVAPPHEAYDNDLLDLSGSSVFSGHDLSDQVLANLILDDADLTDIVLHDSVLADCRLHRATVRDALVKKTDINHLDARAADFTGTRFIHTILDDSDFTGACFDRCQLFGEGWERCRLTDTTWTGATLSNCSWWDIDLTGVRFDGLTGTLMPPIPTADNWWTHHATEVFFHINSHGGEVGWHRGI